MITRLEIENFKAIKRLAIDLDPLTVLVGPNDSGKSTILQALELLSRSLDRPVYDANTPSVFEGDPVESIHGGQRSEAIRIAVASSGRDGDSGSAFTYELSFGDSPHGFGIVRAAYQGAGGVHHVRTDWTPDSRAREWAGPVWPTILRELSSFLVALNPRDLSRPCRPDLPLESSGAGLAALVDRILTDPDRSARDAYEDALRSFSDHVAGVGTRVTRDPQLKELVFGLRDKTRVPAREVSTGLLATAGYLALLHLPASRFLIEEPENGLHPQALLQIVDVLRKLADEGRQVVMTTHSPVLLNYIDAANIRIVTRTEADGVKVTPAVESKVFNEVKQKVDFGALWYSLGDESLAIPR